MSIRGDALRALVVEKLVEAADGIFTLFERTLVEYQAEVLRSKLLQRPRVVLYREDIQTLKVGPEPDKVKQEENPSVNIPLPSVKSENVRRSSPHKVRAAENRPDAEAEKKPAENPSDWEPMNKSPTKPNRPKPSPSKNLVKKSLPRKRHPLSFSCSQCGMNFTQRYTLERHVRNTHNEERPFTCPYCQKAYSRKYEFIVHMRIHTGERPFRCSTCGQAYRCKTSLKDHKCPRSSPHGGPRQGGQPERQNHLLSSASDRELFADIQMVTVGTDSKLEEDLPLKIPLPSVKTEETVEEPPVLYVEENRHEPLCEEEEPGCSMDLLLDNHQGHNGSSDTDNSSDWEYVEEKNPVIDDTQELQAGRGEASGTETVTGNDQPHRCTQCPKSFKNRRGLRQHLERHAGHGYFPCPICNKVYTHKKSFHVHLTVHSEKNPLRCPFCQRVFTKAYLMREHVRIHTGEKPFSCSVCGLTFRLRKERQRHFYRKHTEQMPFTCGVCQKGFVEKYVYVSHMRSHTGELPFRCSTCGLSYKEKKYLKKHVCQGSQSSRSHSSS